jgi:CBS domain-containing protein
MDSSDTADPVTVTAATALEAAALLMSEHPIHHLPVVEARVVLNTGSRGFH